MRIYFATNRDPNNLNNPTDFGSRFSPNGLTDLRFGWADVSGSNFDQYTLTTAPESLAVSLNRAEVGDFSEQKLGSISVFDAIRQEMKQLKQDCVIFVHGFNTSFADAIQRTAQLKEFYSELPLTFFLFTWPSDGRLIGERAYASDRDDARASGVALGRGMQKFAAYLHGTSSEDYCGQKVHLFAHSMGNYALRWAVQGIRSSAGNNLRRLLEQILLFAADEDDDAFEFDYKLQTLSDMARRVTIYHNAGDTALITSNITKGNPERLGASGPHNSMVLPNKVSVVNCESVISRSQDLSGHHYDRLNNMVRQDVLAVLKGLEPQDIKTRKYQPDTRSYRLKRG